MKPQYKPLFEAFTLPNGVEIKNRIVMAPMTTFSANPDDTVSDSEIKYYTRRASGVGMVITACTYVDKHGKAFHGQFAGDTDEFIPSFRRLANAIKSQGAKAIIQIHHGGRLSLPELTPDGQIVGPSNVPATDNPNTPRSLSDAEVEDLVKSYGETTRRAIEAGFDGVEIHGANGYIIQQFFSPHANTRGDRWGGDIHGRLAFPLAVVKEVKRVVAEHAKEPFIVGYRFSPEEPETPGITMEETFVLVDALADQNLDYLHVSLMDFWSNARRGADSTRTRIELLQERVGNRVPLIGVGSIHTADDALRALETGVPFIALARELIMDPEWVQKVAEGRESEIVTTLNRQDQDKLDVPDPLWQAIIGAPGWFPVV
ncbi:NADH-dependent flavin oxidoreductase [Paenibacillus sediminis]|uniref:2,4-dienoyl-CoA reductase-like NADH-dependent reductase (Old Yellow Enzyme family) n=1 Tax=Paenibacillus sediminis TaxID=664909 RepID=A0ABS4H2P1_9BACL|nr:NADH-dependent flavin oxidoreductase [Paenibacillus sediminis]MBP1936773.1 2,4-dienoyl-CoA reductase-like NADH-dependent reductase (Old Yellow Enzyme family) [Paenibacillus sediminis]